MIDTPWALLREDSDEVKRLKNELADLNKRFVDKCVKEARLQMQVDEKWALRRELEAELGITDEMANDESLRVGLEAIRASKRQRDEARGALDKATAELKMWRDGCIVREEERRILATRQSRPRTWGAEYFDTLQMLKEQREDWHKCAEQLAKALRLEAAAEHSGFRRVGTTSALAEFERLKEGGK